MLDFYIKLSPSGLYLQGVDPALDEI